MPKRGEAARLLADLNAEHAPPAPEDSPDDQFDQSERNNKSSNERYNVTTLQEKLPRPNEEPLQETNITSSVSRNERSNERIAVPTQKRTKKSASEETNAASQERMKEGRLPREASGEMSDERGERLEKAMQIAKGDELDVATIRVSAKLHAYLERYVERINRINPKAKYRKQDAIEAAFAAFYADHPMPPAPVEEEL